MDLILFTKSLQDHDIDALIERGHELKVDGYDLAVRPGYAVNPENVHQALPDAARRLRAEGLDVGIVTASTRLTSPEDPTARPILAAMDDADIRLVKLGYFRFDPLSQDYWSEVDEARRALDGWQAMAEGYGVKVCCHTHSGSYLGNNCASLMLLLKGRDPRSIGAFVDTGHLVLEGGPIAMELAMVREYLSIVALKDMLSFRQRREDEGGMGHEVTLAGQGMVAWTEVFAELVRIGYDGPLSAHAEFESPDASTHMAALRREVAYFRHKLSAAQGLER